MDRTMYTSSTPGIVSGDDFMDNVAEKVGALFNAMALKPTSITNVGNDYTIIIDPVLSGDVSGGMGFFIRPNVNNTGPVRLRVSTSNPYYNVNKSNGDALASGDFASDTQYNVVFLDGEFRILSVAGAAADAGAHAFYQEFLVSGTWIKPVGLSPNAILMVEVWGGGAGGSNGTPGPGGGGGAYAFDFLRAGDLTSSVAVTIGAGGAVASIGVSGGNSSFGSYVTAYGGGGGFGGSSTGGGGGGGGATSAGSAGGNGNAGNGGTGAITHNGLIATDGIATTGTAGLGRYGGGGGMSGSGGSAIWGGGGSSTNGGGNSVYGGGGGSGGSGAGQSLYGGNGGNNGVAGSVPGGGGGRNAVGAAGKCIVRVVG